MKRWIPLAILLVSALVHSILLRKITDTFFLVGFSFPSLVFIYFGDELGAQVSRNITEPTPGIFVKAFGWLWLACLVVVLLSGVPFDPRRF